MTNYIIILLIILIFICILYSYKSQDGFESPDIYNNYVNNSVNNSDEIHTIVDLKQSSIPVNDIQGAISGYKIDLSHGNTNIIKELGQTTERDMSNMEKAAICEQASSSCSEFNDSNSFFAKNCGISFDPNGIDSKGNPHIGGLYVSQDDRANQIDTAQDVDENDTSPYDSLLVYKPTLGSSVPGQFVLTKDKCVILQERLDCASKKHVGDANCSQCYSNQNFIRVGPEMGKEKSTLYIYAKGKGTIAISSLNGKIMLTEMKINGETTQIIEVPDDSEGTNFNIRVTGNDGMVAGYLNGQTPNGDFNMDLVRLVKSDTVTGTHPKLNRSKKVNGIQCTIIVPGNKQKSMNLSCVMPFTFLDSYDKDSMYCNNGPVSVQSDSITFLESDPCYSKGNVPGNYKQDCLQSRFISIGGIQDGQGYPNTTQRMDALQKDANGNPLDLYTITNNLSNTINKGITGKDENQRKLSIDDWNSASMFALNKSINTPCDSSDDTELSQDCLSYLYFNKGISSHIGPTYSGKINASSLSNEDSITYCDSAGGMNPANPKGLNMVQGMGINDVKQLYDTIHSRANNNALSNTDRQDAVSKCYGIKLDLNGEQKQIKQVFRNDGSVSCDTYCKGFKGASWNNELPNNWNGAEGVSGYLNDRSCMCKQTGTGWYQGGKESILEWNPNNQYKDGIKI